MGAIADAEAPGCADKRRKSGRDRPAMTDAILVLNGGSSSLKFAVFQQRD
ncbi:acetate kinase, partial [bacterium M00.F.Ca.ET.168.01.1.1]